MFPSSFTCSNPAAICTRAPGLNNLNQQLGCLLVDGGHSGGSCAPLRCPEFEVGNSCPPTSVCDASVGDCVMSINQYHGPMTHSCEDFYLSVIDRALARTPMEGCIGTCSGSSESNCCSGFTPEMIDNHGNVVTDSGLNMDMRYNFGEDLEEPLLTYQNYINSLMYCLIRTQRCPSNPTAATGKAKVCSGHGQCHFDAGAGATESMWSCACSSGHSGTACQYPSPVGGCPLAWNPIKMEPDTCGGATRGICSNSRCTCLPGWSGTDCATRECPTVNGKVCTDHGVCVLNECRCHSGYTGAACNCLESDPSNCEQDVSQGLKSGEASGYNSAMDTAGQASIEKQKASLRTFIIGGGIGFAVIVAIVFYVVFIQKGERKAYTKRRTNLEAQIKAMLVHKAQGNPQIHTK